MRPLPGRLTVMIRAGYAGFSAASFCLAGLTILVGIILLLMTELTSPVWANLVIGATIYLLSQGLRALRLAIIVGDPGKSLRQLVRAHLIGASASFYLPYKLGDLLRIVELAFVLQRPGTFGLWRGILVMWIERVYDALPIACLLLFLGVTIGSSAIHVVLPILAALICFIMATLIAFFVMPENLDGLALFLARRYHGHRVVAILQIIDRLYRLTADARRMLHRKHITLITVSSLIWAGEIVVVSLILGDRTMGTSASTLLQFLSGLLSPSQPHQLDQLSTYSAAIGLPLLTLGLIAWLAACANGRLDKKGYRKPASWFFAKRSS
jgi:hypothetical protein